jgi:hypothetical protein
MLASPVIIMIFGCMVHMLYSHRYGFIRTLTIVSDIVTTFLILIVSVFLYLFHSGDLASKGRRKFLEPLLFIAVLVMYHVGMMYIKQSYDNYQIRNYGKPASGTVTEYEYEGGRGGTQYYATFHYTFQGEQFTQRTPREGQAYAIGDSLYLTVSESDPEIVEVASMKR